jgi:hypothetical protein
MRGHRLQPVLLVVAILVIAPVIMGGSSCQPHAPAPLPPPQSLEKVDDGDVILTLAGGGGGDVQIFGTPTLGAGVALGAEYRPISEFGVSGSMTVGRGGNDGVGTDNVLFQYGVGVDFYLPAPKVKFHPLLLELDIHVTHLSNRSVTFTPSVALSTGFYFTPFELCATLRLGWGLPYKRGRLIVIDDSGRTSYLTRTFHVIPGVAIWFHVGPAALGPFFRYVRSTTNTGNTSYDERLDNYFLGGMAVRFRF